MDVQWIICPILKNYPLFCPKCKQERLIDAEAMKVSVVKEPDA